MFSAHFIFEFCSGLLKECSMSLQVSTVFPVYDLNTILNLDIGLNNKRNAQIYQSLVIDFPNTGQFVYYFILKFLFIFPFSTQNLFKTLHRSTASVFFCLSLIIMAQVFFNGKLEAFKYIKQKRIQLSNMVRAKEFVF